MHTRALAEGTESAEKRQKEAASRLSEKFGLTRDYFSGPWEPDFMVRQLRERERLADLLEDVAAAVLGPEATREEDREDLEAQRKAVLVEEAEARGIETAGDTKAEVVEALLDAEDREARLRELEEMETGELRRVAGSRGLDAGGKKTDLIARVIGVEFPE